MTQSLQACFLPCQESFPCCHNSTLVVSAFLYCCYHGRKWRICETQRNLLCLLSSCASAQPIDVHIVQLIKQLRHTILFHGAHLYAWIHLDYLKTCSHTKLCKQVQLPVLQK